MTGPGELAELIFTLQRLKRIPRTGWLDRGVLPADTESVADHTCLTALTAWLLSVEDPDLDSDRVLKLAILHDIAEAIIGDQPPYEADDLPDRANREAIYAFFSVRHTRSPAQSASKKRAEQGAFEAMTAKLSPSLRKELAALWDEYETRSTPEARFVKQVDTLEAYMQARHYAETDSNLPFQGFTDMAANEIDHPRLVALRDAASSQLP